MSKIKASGFSAVVEALAAEDFPHLKELGRRQRRAAETRVRLFRTAVQLFAKRGFGNVTVEDITEAADVGKGTFFNYFESKDHVFGVMAEIQLGKVKEALIRSEAGNETTFATLRRLFSRVGEEPGRSAELTRALISSITGSDRVRIVMSETHGGRATDARPHHSVGPGTRGSRGSFKAIASCACLPTICNGHDVAVVSSWRWAA